MTEAEARRVVLVQAHEEGAPTSVWTDDDRAWATRAARQDAGDDATFERFLTLRAQHALARLLPRDPDARRWLDGRRWRPAWIAVVAVAALALGLAADRISTGQRIDLLAPPVWALVLWNLAMYLGMLVPGRTHALRRWLSRLGIGTADGKPGVQRLWAGPGLRLAMPRAALVLHVAAAMLALGLAGGMYLRGLVLDYRAGWQSTFLDATSVQAVLDVALAPAAAVTGIAVPEVAPLRLAPGASATAGAAPWIHLYAATLALFVVLPRALLALIAALQSWQRTRRFPLPLDGAYFERLRLQQSGGRMVFDVRPHGAPMGAAAALGLRSLLAAHWGPDVDLRVGEPVAYGDEEQTAAAPVGATLRLALFDLGATPEDEAQGRLLDVLSGPLPVLALVDESAFARRFQGQPTRLEERRAAWQRLARAHHAGIVCTDLAQPDLTAGARDLKAALP
ncbi:DUF2868 domain-containing protein [Rhizobacter sp. LjRoot28]|uniref:DUF2868 domain-containing protein n=1 Tax=Rhizobacter sp. LjRoot28 TaxID=3342309 RepID=UPI003ECD7DC9